MGKGEHVGKGVHMGKGEHVGKGGQGEMVGLVRSNRCVRMGGHTGILQGWA